ncbi:hypothetical protein BT69DRAFT_1275630 [Atractiella rhizophila]|nr:hypothetical protein BT69DRAFT_1275630 [Atractiella rhizophila]
MALQSTSPFFPLSFLAYLHQFTCSGSHLSCLLNSGAGIMGRQNYPTSLWQVSKMKSNPTVQGVFASRWRRKLLR